MHESSASGPNPAIPPPDRSVKKRWSPALVEGGFTPVSNFFLEHYTRIPSFPGRVPIKLTSTEAMVVLQIFRHHWGDGRPARVSLGKIAQRMGVDRRTVRGALSKLESYGFIKRNRPTNNSTNRFDLSGLIKALEYLHAQLKAETEKRELEFGAGEAA